MHLFRHRFSRHERHFVFAEGLRGRVGALWDAARFHRRAAWGHPHAHGTTTSAFEHQVPAGAGFTERLQQRAAAYLDLDDHQAELMARLFDSLAAARRAAKALARRDDVVALTASETFARDEAQALFDQQVDALKASGPGLVAAFGDFFDALDFEQQQMVRFALRRGRDRRHSGAHRGGHGHRHDTAHAHDAGCDF